MDQIPCLFLYPDTTIETMSGLYPGLSALHFHIFQNTASVARHIFSEALTAEYNTKRMRKACLNVLYSAATLHLEDASQKTESKYNKLIPLYPIYLKQAGYVTI